MFQINNCKKKFYYKPYPIGNLVNLIEPKIYEKLVETFPNKDLFEFKKDLGKKYSLSEINHKKKYFDFIKKKKIWNDFYNFIKTKSFREQIFDMLKQNQIDLGLTIDKEKNLKNSTINKLKNIIFMKKIKLNSRFEFSMMDTDLGHILPHTDSPNKLVTIVIPILDDKWEEKWGGDTCILEPIDENKSFNYQNKYLKFDEVKTINKMKFEKNSSTIFIKTFNSLHCVYPIKGPSGSFRKSLTINIEKLN